MGLDMYLYRRRYVKNWDHYGPEERTQVLLNVGGESVPLTNPSYIDEEIMYWRKANQIHGYIVEHFAGGEDKCQKIYLEREQLQELLDVCNQVIAASELVSGQVYNGTQYSKGKTTVLMESGQVIKDATVAKELLPVTAGFFFGNYDEETAYDQWYLEDVQRTAEMLKKVLAEPENYNVSYYYEASW